MASSVTGGWRFGVGHLLSSPLAFESRLLRFWQISYFKRKSNNYLWSSQIGHTYHTSVPKTQGTCWKKELKVCKSQRSGRMRAKLSSGDECIHELIATVVAGTRSTGDWASQHSMWTCEPPTLSWETMDSWWLLGEEEFIFFRSVISARLTMAGFTLLHIWTPLIRLGELF